ncbi:hypothetical protein ES703_58618 [subsurface metagenome]
MAEGIKNVAFVTTAAECASGIDFPAGVKQQGLITKHHNKGADVIVVVMFLVMAALEGNGQT